MQDTSKSNIFPKTLSIDGNINMITSTITMYTSFLETLFRASESFDSIGGTSKIIPYTIIFTIQII